ncbi:MULTISPECIES: hypothetical protein [Pseudomonas]|uniref:hypothetical protein n=1 Tax=Pseudomonas TaxID=286 RepID=UPI0009ED54E4|nr:MULTISPECIES: hypothetical protein [Pseudomonas]
MARVGHCLSDSGTQASFRVHGARERFLTAARRGWVIRFECTAVAGVKHQIEALGVPLGLARQALMSGAGLAWQYLAQ